MGIASIILGVLSMIFAVAGFLLSWVPVLGALLSFGAPMLALIGIVLGGVGMSRAKQEGGETGIPMAGMIVCIVCFFPALLVALTCGVCNTMCTTASMNAPDRPRSNTATPWYLDGGSSQSPGLGPQPAQPAPVPQPAQPLQPQQAPQPPQLPDPTPPDPAGMNPSPIPGGPPPGYPPPPDQPI